MTQFGAEAPRVATADELAPVPAASARRVWPRILAIICFFAAFEGILFHTEIYSSIIEPVSTTGGMELQLRDEIRRPKPNRNQVLAVGHSRMALRPRVVNEEKPGTGYTFATIGLGGTSPRTWYYELRAVDPEAHNYAAIVIPTDDYNELDTYDDHAEREADLHYLIARLELRDLLEFPWTYPGKKLQWEIARGIIFKGTIYKRDFLDFLDHPLTRIAKARFYASGSAGWYYGYRGNETSLAGLQIDWQRRTMQFPSSITEDQRKAIKEVVFSDLPPDQGRETAYLRYWYARIIERYRGSGTKLIFLRVPRAPQSPPDPAPKRNSAIRQIASQPDVIVLDERLFNPLEHPDLFEDGMHLNRDGMEQFSKILGAEVRRVLGPPKS
jgi:hypothetical protein